MCTSCLHKFLSPNSDASCCASEKKLSHAWKFSTKNRSWSPQWGQKKTKTGHGHQPLTTLYLHSTFQLQIYWTSWDIISQKSIIYNHPARQSVSQSISLRSHLRGSVNYQSGLSHATLIIINVFSTNIQTEYIVQFWQLLLPEKPHSWMDWPGLRLVTECKLLAIVAAIISTCQMT